MGEAKEAKKCPDGKYWCFDKKKCMPIPRGYHIGRSGYLAHDHDDTKKNGNGNGSSNCLLYTSPSPRDRTRSRMPSSA